MKGYNCALLLLLMIYFVPVSDSYAQSQDDSLKTLRSKAPRTYIDCDYCDMNYIKKEIIFVNHVRDRKEAQVHVLITTQNTASGGTEYTISFIGQQDYKGIDNILKYVSKQSDTEDNIRKGIVKVLKVGLVPYVVKTPLADQISISYEEKKETSVVDKWDNWVFSIKLDSWFNGEQSTSYINLWGSLSANRITSNWKIRSSVNAGYYENRFTIEDEKVSSFSRNKSFSVLIVKSLNNHWSAGGSGSGFSSTYSNTKLNLAVAPAVEYDLFPYSESTKKQLRFLYKISPNYYRYSEETIYGKTTERLLNENLSVTLEVKQTWGSVETHLEGFHYFHDLNKRHLELYSELSLKLFKGISLNLYGEYSLIHDQLSLPKGGATTEDILLQRKQLATQYNYWGSVGLSYTFGSIYSNIVNPRFGD